MSEGGASGVFDPTLDRLINSIRLQRGQDATMALCYRLTAPAWRVAVVLDNAASVFPNRRIDSVGQEHCQFRVRTLFVIVHEPGIARNIGRQDRR